MINGTILCFKHSPNIISLPTLPFPSWNGWIHKNNNHLSEDELTEENIQKEIDIVGTLWGMEIMKQFQKLEWISIAFNSEICKIYIPENTELNDEIN